MQYEVEVGGRRSRSSVTRSGDGFAVSVDGHTRQVDAARIDAHTLSLLVDSVWSNEVSIAAHPASGQLDVHVGVDRRSPSRSTAGAAGDGRKTGDAGSGPQRLVAPMPGKVVRVLVKKGDAVTARQPIVVVEAMKMENELRASHDGTVAEIHVSEGMSVDAGALLLVIQ